ncbi:DEKNAAC103596 [Brettanomyces naardenensis]|uniref:DEKNAAC103596 n=1 Tax=Brettanomyces naardenensis TaxID=13370 RepID=A0A448YN96_BRENA|nr:DEKNAAC103596 [Brettanomyces naardenensis]
MFGYKFFGNYGEDNYVTPKEFQVKAREDINNHVRKIREQGGFDEVRKRRLLPTRLLGKPKKDAESETSSTESTSSSSSRFMTYISSPLRKTVSIDSSSDASSIDSGSSSGSGPSTASTFQQQSRMLRHMPTTSTYENSVFSSNAQLARIYTNTTVPSTAMFPSGPTSLQENGTLSLNDALPKDFSDYYAQDLNTERFSNGRPVFTRRNLKGWELNDIRSLVIYPDLRPEWHGKIPEVVSPYPNVIFRIQIIPLQLSDNEFVDCLAHSDIYRESKFDLAFRESTARYIVEKARLRHRSILQTNFGVPEEAFDQSTNLVNNIQYDAYFKFEWRNVIENYLLNLGIENQCRLEFKEQITKLKRVNQHKVNCNGSDNLYKKVLAHNNKVSLDDGVKMQIWHDVQKKVYERLDMATE